MSSQAKIIEDQDRSNQKQEKQRQRSGDDVANTKMVQPQSCDGHGLRSDREKHSNQELVDCNEYEDGSADVTGKCYGMTQQAHHFRCVGSVKKSSA
uniref:Uncharacterized protein n=1 Tax=Chenopodium quinoa TaxID=63459 RepID=A0A803LQC0_CHEQI